MINTIPANARQSSHQRQAWHPADIVAAVRKAGTSLRRLSRSNGFNEYTMSKSLRLCFPACHDLIAELIGVPRQSIWPQFYDAQGKRMSLRERRRRQIVAELKQRAA